MTATPGSSPSRQGGSINALDVPFHLSDEESQGMTRMLRCHRRVAGGQQIGDVATEWCVDEIR